MTHNLTVTVDDELWTEMQKYTEIRWSAVMKEATKEKIKALKILEKFVKKTKMSESEIENFAIKLGKKVTNRR